MRKFKLIALTTPVAGKEKEFHAWYQEKHLPEMASLMGVKGAQRYKLVVKMMGADPNQWLALYEIEAEDPMAFLDAMRKASADGKLTQGVTADMATTYTALFEEFGERVLPSL